MFLASKCMFAGIYDSWLENAIKETFLAACIYDKRKNHSVEIISDQTNRSFQV